MSTVRTRFAPSPTGFLHIGGVRTALFNWLFARRHEGHYILRIDDTDQQRNVEAALAPILHGFEWLGIGWDEGPVVGGPHAPYFQSQRSARYQEAIDVLVARGAAYYDYARPEEIEAERKVATDGKCQFQYSRRWMASNEEERARFAAEGRGWVVRLKMPREGTLVLNDLVRGEVQFEWTQEADHVVQRGDKSFIYHLANVVDDFDFGVSHVIRAEEHLSNTPRQVYIIDALGYPRPKHAHLPYVAEPGSKRKLSKRKLDQYLKNPDFKKVHDHGTQIAQRLQLQTTAETFNPVIVDFYEQVGYLNEYLTREQMIESFGLERVNPAPASFDPAKLLAFQTQYMKAVPVDEKVRRVRSYLERAGWLANATEADDTYLTRVVEALGDRLKVFGDVLLEGAFFFGEAVTFDDKAFDKRLRAPGAIDKLRDYRAWLAEQPDFSAAALDAGTRAWLTERSLGLGDIVHAVRVATTGVAGGPGLFDCLAVLGRDRCLRRIDTAIARAGG